MLDTTHDPRARAIVIGSGFGGLAAAVRLGARGYRVSVLEKLDKPGGRAYTYTQDGYTFDAGPTIITAPYLLDELWELAGKRFADHIDLRASDPYYDIRFDDGRIFRYSGDHDHMRAEVAKFNPNDLEGFERFMEVSADIYKTAFEKLAHVPFHSLTFTLKEAPELVRLGGYNSVYNTVCRYLKDPCLRVVFSFHPLLIGGNPLTTTAYYCLIANLERKFGVHYAMGGTGALVRGLVELIEGQGGEVICNAPVDEIRVENGIAVGVTLESGEKLDSAITVSNADSAFTYKNLLRNHRRKTWTDGALSRRDYSMSLFVWYFGTNKRFEDVPHHCMVLGPRYQELLKDIFSRKKLAKDFSLYLHRPTASDPSLAPEGCDAFYVLSPVPNLKSGTDWSQKAEPYRQAIQKRLEETVLPGLGESIVTQRMLTPQDFKDRLNSINGAAFAIEPKLFQSAWFRPHNKSQEAKNLFLVGAGTHPGAGVPGVISSARVLDTVAPDASVFARL